ncbi:FAD-binding protein [Rhodocytophaga rosea]|uniref:FAD-binding protein n=1 Tax=Rhodocytophaga rosea TaxID=2704465 RepID=A0A6C0GT73_9BACT|nr:D-arabinono-1,4-lactone oxidase [Rhodocytophaga rosea]QHT71365.1 FAD-binding protein [Rhodocytophaga rosea]
MKKRKFLQVSSAVAAGSMILPLQAFKPNEKLKNWAGNIEYSTDKVYYPKTLTEIQSLVKKYTRLKGLGTRHCFNRIADSKDNLLSLRDINKVVSLDTNARTVTVEGGIKYGELAPYLHEKGFALHNLASLPHISVAGSCTTATHGSGVKMGNLATAVVGLEMVSADGTVHTLSKEKDGDTFNGVVVGLGALGIVTKVTLRIEPTYMMQQYVYEKLPLTQLKDNFDKIVSAGYSVSLFTDWQQESINEVWVKRRVHEAAMNETAQGFFGAKAATKNMHPIAELSAENCTEQMGVKGPWYERLPHFKMGFTPSSGKELQAEYFVPRTQAVEAFMAIQRMGKQIGPHLFISEIRTIEADDLWMSPCYKQPSVAIHFTWKQDWPAVSKLLPVIEKELAPFNARPHWGKLFTMSSQVLASRYEKLTDFKKLITRYDPQGKFRNEFLSNGFYTT